MLNVDCIGDTNAVSAVSRLREERGVLMGEISGPPLELVAVLAKRLSWVKVGEGCEYTEETLWR
jgi:hypothetical protein